MQLTAEQLLIRTAATDTSDNLIVNARAGAAKTTTIELIAQALPAVSILCLAFNKKIADTLQQRLPENCEAQTMNSLGNRAWRNYLGKWPKLNKAKSFFLVKAIIEELDADDKDEAYEGLSEILEALREAKSRGYLPSKLHPQAKPLCGPDDFFEALDFEPTELQRIIIDEAVKRSFLAALKGEIDFDDQILMPALMPCSFPAPALTMVDEAQDLSAINHVILRKLVGKRRVIAVGDPCQAIYAFRGASDNSMSELQQLFDMKELYLTTCFRSAQSIIKAARWRAPDMMWREGAPAGTVEHLSEWGSTYVLDGDAIICRNNAPLFTMAVQLLAAGRNPELASGDIVAGLTSAMKKLGKPKMEQAEALVALEHWQAGAEGKRKDKARVRDQAECIRIFLEARPALGEALAFLEEVCGRPGRIKLMTGHKSKGLEFDRVFFLDPELCQMKRGQDKNIKYVIETRAREALFYVKSDGWRGLHKALDNTAAA
jgi:superfamily I DNA/RNA helicase